MTETPAAALDRRLARLEWLTEDNHADRFLSFGGLLRKASVKLHRYLDAEHPAGCVARDLPGEAADLLRQAGYRELADRCAEAEGDGDITALMNEIDALAAGRVCPVFKTLTGAG